MGQATGKITPILSRKSSVPMKAAKSPHIGMKKKHRFIDTKDAVKESWVDTRMTQNVLLLWLDENINEEEAGHQNTLAQLRRVVDNVNTYTDSEKCIEFLESRNNEQVCMIISGSRGQYIVPRIHNISQVHSIFILCRNKEYHEQWTESWPKIKGIFTEINPICDALVQAAQTCEQDTIPISIMGINEDISKKRLDQLDPSFMYTQVMKEILLTIKFEQQHFQEFINYCRDVLSSNERELKKLDKFQRTYRHQTPIWWYTLDSFLYPILNRALRLMDTNVIIKLGFFIGDLHRHIEQLHHEQFSNSKSKKTFSVYRGQGMNKAQFEEMIAKKGGLLSFNFFLSTSKYRTVSLSFARHAATNPDLVGVLFVMMIDPSQSTTPFASINDVSYYRDNEDEVLFSMHTVFRIGAITSMDKHHRLFQVELTLTNDNDKGLCQLTDRIREETFPDDEGWNRLALVLLKIGRFENAEKIYGTLLEHAVDDEEKANIYNQLGCIKDDQGEYREAIEFYEKTLKIQKENLPSDHPDLAAPYNNIGLAYYNLGEYSTALSFYEKALIIQQKALPANHLDLTISYNNIGLVYYNLNEYVEALSFHEKALQIRQQSLPPNHPDIGASYNNFGLVYYKMGKHREALSSCEKALDIQQQSLPSNHPDLANTYNNIGSLYGQLDENSKALPYLERARAIQEQALPANHPSFTASYDNYGLVQESMGNHSEAQSFYERAVNHAERTLPSHHPNMQQWKGNLERVRKNHD